MRDTRFSKRASGAIAAVSLTALLAAAALVTAPYIGKASEAAPLTMQDRDTACVGLLPFLNPQSHSDPAQRSIARECVNKVDAARRASAQSQVVREDLRLARTYSMIPEYHDEQRLAIGATDLGPMAGIYASPHLDDFKHEWQFEEHGEAGVFVAHVVVQRQSWEATQLPPTYRQLGLAEGLNCVWLIKTSGSDWKARILPARGGTVCDPSYAPPAPWTAPDLRVVRDSPVPDDAAYPPVARFDESQADRPVLGVKCLAGWCEIGAGAFSTRPALGTAVPGLGLRGRIKGWYDEQVLSVVNPAGRFVKGGLRAALVPMPGLENKSSGDFNTWVHVATLYLDRNPSPNSKYDSWGLAAGANEIWLYHPPGRPWEAELRRADRPSRRWNFVDRESHRDVGVPGTVRFRWSILDDGIWAPCGQSCCQVEG